MSERLNIIILAAGKGSRMGSSLPKVLHPVGGQPMIARILKMVNQIPSVEIRVVVGNGENFISSIAAKYNGLCFKQKEDAWGTAKAVEAACPDELKGDVLIMNGDHPLISLHDLNNFIKSHRELKSDFSIAGFNTKETNVFGRIICDGQQVTEIVEAKDVKEKNKTSSLVNTGMYLTKSETLSKYIKNIVKNKSGEYYFTDIVSLCHKAGLKVRTVPVGWNVAFGVNTQQELSVAGNIIFENKCYELMNRGVIIVDMKNTYIESDVTVGAGSMIYPNVYLKGHTKIGSFCAIESHSFIFDSIIKNYVNIKSGSYIEKSQVDEKSIIGPYAHLREGSEIGKECKVGNFVETKKTKLGDGSKASHLSYLGDAEIGKKVNVGCGTVTCNYGVDRKKRQTKIGDEVFVGSGVQLVAPVKIGDKAVLGAGSVITKDVPKNSLALERSEQKNISDYGNKKRD